MIRWEKNVQTIVDIVDEAIRSGCDEALTIKQVADRIGYSEYHFSRKFREVSGMQFREYLSQRKLALSAKALLNCDDSILSIAVRYGFSSNEAFTRAFRDAFGITPSAYRRDPVPLVLRTIIRPFDCYLLENGSNASGVAGEVKTYFVTIPSHKFLHIRNYESIGYWDFWQKQSLIPGQDCDTICGLLHSIKGKLDDLGGDENDSGSGQIMAYINDPAGRICSWGIPLAECYGVRLPEDYEGPIPSQMMITRIPEGEYIVFEHGPFDFERDNAAVEQKIESAMREFDYTSAGYKLDTAPGRIFYFYHDCTRYWKYIRPVVRV